MSTLDPRLSSDLAKALRTLGLFEPFRSSIARPQWQEAMTTAEGICATLKLIEAYRPGLLSALALDALTEAEIREQPMIEIDALVKRYARRVEKL